MNVNIKKIKKNNEKYKNQIIKRKNDEIELLKRQIEELKLDDSVSKELYEIIDNLRSKEKDLDKLIKETKEMKNAVNKMIFHKKWKLIKWLLK